MCTNSHYIYNKYSRKAVLVSCGNCPACMQEKANATATRIRNNVSSGTITLFCTFTYTNDYVPYIKKSDLLGDSFDVPVYRNNDIRYIYDKTNGLRLKKDFGIRQVSSAFIEPSIRTNSNVYSLHKLEGMDSDKVGVCLTSDFQKFLKRLRNHLLKTLHHEIKFTYFQCSEFGSITKRPHFHALFFIPASYEEQFRNSLVTCWSYADRDRTKKYVELARDASSYVASYVNSTHSVPEILKDAHFKQKHSFSLGFGVGLDCFSLLEILQKIDRGDLSYYSERQFDGTSCTLVLPIPQYVLNRFFPKFKGFAVLPRTTLESILFAPSRTYILESKGFVNSFAPQYSFTREECREIAVRLENSYRRFHRLSGLGRFDYVFYYLRCWQVRTNTLNRLLYESLDSDLDIKDFYENIQDVEFGLVRTDLDITDCQRFPNMRSDIVQKTTHLTDLYYKKDKARKVTNFVMSYNGHNV